MEDSLLLQSLTTNPSGTASSFPLYRRRPLRSRTYDTLIRILSHCRPQLHVRGPACEEDRLITQSQVISTDELELHPKSKGSEEKVVREASDAEANENIGFQDFDGNPATTSNLHQPGLVRDNEKELVSSNEIRIDDYLVVEEKAADCVVQNTKELDNVNGVLDIQMDDFGTLEDVELDENLCFHRLNEVLDSCLDLDMVDKSSEARQLSKEKGIVSEENMAKGVEYELQMKEVELEKLVYSSGNTDAPICENGGDIEEGEISGDAGIVDESFNTLSEGAVLEEEAAENLHASEGYIDKDKLLLEDKERGRQLLGMTDPSMGNIVDIESNPKNVKNNMPARQLQDYHDLDVLRGSHVKTRKSTPHSLDNPTPPGRILQANAAENQISMTTEKDEDASTRKRKRSLTKERRAKKKKKERIKRAEKNRELGVKRLKLPTIVKPKKIVYCRHYLQGRCHEGEKCKFSHDTVPLTKSKPCGHFARHSCLKGDDCPFDHQLSKYPCNNYTSNGFCNRGSECMFSHEMPATSPSATPSVSKHDLISPHKTVPEKGPHPMSTVNKSGLKSPSPLNNPSSSCDTSHQKVNSRLGYAANSAGQREQLTLKPVPGSGGRAPRGVSFLLNGALSLGDTGKEKQDWSPAQRTDAVGAGCKETLKEPGAVNELNEMSEGVAPRKPRGINFLSFGQPPSNDSSSKILSDLLSKYNEGTGKSAIDDVGKGKGKASLDSSKGDTAFSFVKEAQGTSELQATFGTPSSSSPGKNANLSSSFNAFSFVKEAQGTSELQATIGTPLSSSPGKNANLSSSFKTVFLSNTPSLVRKAVQSTLAFAAQLEPDIKTEVFRLRQQQEMTQSYLAAVEKRLQLTEMKQKQMTLFLIKFIKNPLLLQRISEKMKKVKALSSGENVKKRRFASSEIKDNSLMAAVRAVDIDEIEKAAVDDKRIQLHEKLAAIQSDIQTLFSSDESGSPAEEHNAPSYSETHSRDDSSSENFVLWEKLLEDDMIYEDETASSMQQCDNISELDNASANPVECGTHMRGLVELVGCLTSIA